MDITSTGRGNYRKLALAGQFWRREDIEALEKYVAVCISAQRPWIILDLDRLSFVNSQALGLLVRLHHRCAEAGGKFILYQARSNVREMIDVSDLPQFIPIADTPQELDERISGK